MTNDAPTRAPPEVRVETLTSDALRRHLPDLARLRASVFRDWPYLYDAEPGYEESYRGPYASSPGAGLVLAFAGDHTVGAATCLPLADETPNVQAPFLQRGLDPTRFFYFGESVLLPAYRGRGLGVAFFTHREAHAAAASSADFACFCAVQRPETHPQRSKDAGTLDQFWARRGYTKRPDLVATMRWRDIGDAEETEKTMVFWLKPLRPGAALP